MTLYTGFTVNHGFYKVRHLGEIAALQYLLPVGHEQRDAYAE